MDTTPSKDQIHQGMSVHIEKKQDQGTGKLTEGIVKKILTSGNTHPHGIMVELENGEVGRIKKITNSKIIPLQSTSNKFEDISKKEIPKVENKSNEFKEFYQYDEGIDNLPNAIPPDKKSNIIEEKKQQVRERFATAVCSFGNDSVGGFVYLGVNSDGMIMGLEKDKKLGNFSNYDDVFANHIRDVLETFLDDRIFIISKLQIKFTERNSKTICILQILPATEPLFLHNRKGKEFFVRGSSPRAEHLDGKEMFSYIKERFPNYH
jgi:uncharacterized repeat protein (TIGR03833 family)